MATEMPRVADAVVFALRCHEGQEYKRKGDTWPFAVHVICVALRMESPAEQIVALLHDVVEDCGVELREIGERFGEQVEINVWYLTRRDGETYSDYLYRVRRQELARKVKLADLAENLDKCEGEDAPDFTRSLIRRYREAVVFLETKV